jgi:hypothetical protein
MNRVEAAQKQWFDREVADRAEADEWARQRKAATLPPTRARAQTEESKPARPESELGWWQRLRRAIGLGASDRAPTAGGDR